MSIKLPDVNEFAKALDDELLGKIFHNDPKLQIYCNSCGIIFEVFPQVDKKHEDGHGCVACCSTHTTAYYPISQNILKYLIRKYGCEPCPS